MMDKTVIDLRQSFLEFRRDTVAAGLVLDASRRCVDNGFTREMADAFLNSDNKDVLEFLGWELIGLVSKLNGEINEEHNIKLLDCIAETCNPREVCLGIVEQMDAELSMPVFEALLTPLQKAFGNLKTKKPEFLKMILPKITRQVRIFTSQDNEDEENKADKISLMDRVIELTAFVIEEIGPFQASEGENNIVETDENQTWEVIKCLIGLLEALSSENLISQARDSAIQEIDDTSSKLSFKDHAINIVTLLCKLHHCPIITIMENSSIHSRESKENPLEKSNTTKEQDSSIDVEETSMNSNAEVLSLLGIGCLSYLLLVEEANILCIPKVIRFDYLLKINLNCISCLLLRTNVLSNYKGLELLSSLLCKIECGSLEYHMLKYPGFLDVPKALIKIMVYSISKPIRQQATAVLLKLIDKLDTRGRYVLLRYLMLDCSHAGVAALLIYCIKEEVHKNLNSGNKETWFRDTQLISLLRAVCMVQQGIETEKDLVSETERIMACLNCFRYILLRDQEDKTTLWKNYCMFERDFFKPLQESIKITRVRYLAEQKKKLDKDKEMDKRKENVENRIDFTVTTPDGTPINEISQEDQMQVLCSGLHALDMMDCVLAHISEIVNSKA